ncbi:c-type cytochrome biogenesis protein CcmI [Ferrimonas balearica]|uniref:c-type cytochrome biogenesis protein CcmI n=1 Tax=Ferrimonas balearica TaxID=44012 RepID=UPI001C56279C|nr:c-type cytochrome biogenesis protein CcmI [Ferrimonas balearica]MBW3141665.1 c-type cytochrome biogenesis protein CcmI [Ferrimonas balearica]MBW3166659.1 c-type cytochrome biogenesis protein CcmI [Ferrimonas balearica]MBY6108711.1 c-type cytochrome biogenesis protein CcmI [Ferrimonas balearica]MBY6226605.1 c-type cytochrome biogenesis protein CcmI [Ferrimonas balearica]
MTTFWFGIAVLSALALFTIWLPFWRRQKALAAASDAQVRKQTNLSLFNERLKELETDLAEGRINEQEFEDFKKELQLNLLQNTEQEDHVLDAKKPSILWPAIMSVALLAVAGYTYHDLGRYSDWQNAQVGGNDPHAGMNPDQLMQMRLAQMEQAVQADPSNSQAWFSLGHAYISASQYTKAIEAFDTVMSLVGEHAELLGPKATAMYYLNGQKMNPEIQGIVEKALADDNKDPSTRLLLGMDAFFNANYETAIEHWEIILTSPREDVDRQAILGAISQARMHLEQGGAAMGGETAAPEQAATTGKTLTVTVELADAVKAQANQSDSLFLFARPVSGPAMPVAVARLNVADLPTQVVLDDSTAMSPDMVISAHSQVNLVATINHDGSPAPTPGDLLGELNAVDLGTQVTLVIDTIVE